MSDPMNDVDLRIALARLDERLKALVTDIARTEVSGATALKISSEELARRLMDLNHAHQEAQRVLGTYVTRDVYERDKKEGENRLSALENAAASLAGKLWLPLIAVAGIAAGLAAWAVSLLGR